MSRLVEPAERRITTPYLEDVKTVLRELGSDAREGLSNSEGHVRLDRDGFNELCTGRTNPRLALSACAVSGSAGLSAALCRDHQFGYLVSGGSRGLAL